MVKVGVVGVGSMGINHVRVYSEMNDVELAGVADKDEKTGRSASGTFDTCFYGDYKEIIGKVDAVSIAAPTQFHYSIARDFLNSGVDVLIEKPITRDIGEANELIKIAEKNNLVLQVGHIERFNPAVIELKKFIDSDIIMVSANRVGPLGARITDAGVVLDLMIHDIDIVLDLIGSEIEKISAYGRSVYREHEDAACAMLKFKRGEIVKLTASRVTQKRDRRLKVTLKGKYIEVDYMNKILGMHKHSKSEYITEDKDIRFITSEVVEKPYIPQTEPLKLELRSFIDCVKTREPPVVDGAAGRNALDIALKILDKINEK